MPLRAKLRAVNKEVTSNEGRNHADGSRARDTIDDTAKKRSKSNSSKLNEQKKRKKAKSKGAMVYGIGDSSDGSSDDSSDEGDNSEKNNLVKDNKQKMTKEQYTFEFNDMKSDYTESICSILKFSLIINPSAAFVLASSITEQAIVGTAVVCEGGDDVFGFATVLPTEKILNDTKISKKNSILNPLVVLFNEFQLKLSCLADKSVQSTFNKYLFDPIHRGASGLLLQSRFNNLPLQLIVDLHKNLNDDIKYALKHSDSEDGFQGMKYLIHICKCTINGNTPSGVVNITGSASALYDQFEDEVYSQDADHVLLFTPSNYQSSLAICLININKLDNIQNNIAKLC